MCAPWSVNLQRHGGEQVLMSYSLLVVSFGIVAFALWGDSPMMPAEVYGNWVVSFHAETWGCSILVAACLHLMGISINGAHRISPFLRLAGCMWQAMTLSAFAVGCSTAIYGDLFALSVGVFAIVHVWFCLLNVADAARAVMRSGADGGV